MNLSPETEKAIEAMFESKFSGTCRGIQVMDMLDFKGAINEVLSSPELLAKEGYLPVFQECDTCGGDGKETCNNPDHGFIDAMPGDIGRLGCPVCRHDPKHKVKNGGACEDCNGTGKHQMYFDKSEYESAIRKAMGKGWDAGESFSGWSILWLLGKRINFQFHQTGNHLLIHHYNREI